MSVVWVRDNLVKYLRENREGIKDTILAGVKDMSQLEYLRGQYTALAQVETELRELLGKVIEDDENDEQGNST
jgi:hypothetical protein|tara:strand:- start:712 stop:930 length:219 start_codon:yes stop_codon:yes gene_type:complete